MKHYSILSLAIACALALPSAAGSSPQSSVYVDLEALARVPYAPHLIVQLLPGQSVAPFAAATGSQVVYSDQRTGLNLLAVPSGLSMDDVDALATAIKGFPTVIFAEADEPNDPPEVADCGPGGGTVGVQQCTIAFIDGSPMPTTYPEQYAKHLIQADAAQDELVKKGIAPVPMVVAVVDTGVQYSHPLLAPHLLPGLDMLGGALLPGSDVPDGLDNDFDGLVDEGTGHGTHVSGLVLLADPSAKLLPVRALDSDGNGSAFLVGLAIHAAVDAHAQVINLSLSSRNDCEVIAEALKYAEYKGVLCVTSAGNTGGDPLFPASYHVEDYPSPIWLPPGTALTGLNLMSVAAVDMLNVKAPFSCLGADVDISAPGVSVYSSQMNGNMAWWSGTSMSSGVASGAVSFLLSVWGQGSYSGGPIQLLKATADNIDSENPGCTGKLGAGEIQLYSALKVLLHL